MLLSCRIYDCTEASYLPPSAWRTCTKISICKKHIQGFRQKQTTKPSRQEFPIQWKLRQTWDLGIKFVKMHSSMVWRITRDISVERLRASRMKILIINFIYGCNTVTLNQIEGSSKHYMLSDWTGIEHITYHPLVFSFDLQY